MKDIFISLGSNMGNREAHLNNAIREMAKNGMIIEKKSSIYESEAWGYEDQSCFLNQVVEISTDLSPERLLHQLKIIEQVGGRQKRNKWRKREIDLDILYYGQKIMDTSVLQIPHQYVRERSFVLIPLAEIASDFTDPEIHRTIQDIARLCPDQRNVSLHKFTE